MCVSVQRCNTLVGTPSLTMLPRASSYTRGFPCSGGPHHISFVLPPGAPSFICVFPCSGEPLHINFVLLPSAPSLMCVFPCSGDPLHINFVLPPGAPSFICGFPCSGDPLHKKFVLLPSAPSLMCGFPCSGGPLHVLHIASIAQAFPFVAVHAQVLCGGYAWHGSCCFDVSACRSNQVTRREDDCNPSAMDARRSGCAPSWRILPRARVQSTMCLPS